MGVNIFQVRLSNEAPQHIKQLQKDVVNLAHAVALMQYSIVEYDAAHDAFNTLIITIPNLGTEDTKVI